jgi:histidyl-tRNA synthetase
MMKQMQPVRGTSDLIPEEKARQNKVISTALTIAEQYGFRDMATPIFEFTEVFSRPLGASSDVVSKETYTFDDRGGTSLTLRPEGTAAAMRAVISNGLTQALPHRWFYAGPMFRYERPQKGRMRQFHQFGCELIGPHSALADAEIIGCGAQILEELGVLDKCVLQLNSLGDTQSRQDFRDALITYFTRFSEDLSEDSRRRLETNPLRILDSKDAGDRALLDDAPRLPDYLSNEARRHFNGVTAALDAAQIGWTHAPFLVRGLDYYAHTAFEFVTDALGAQGTVLGGGRYDGLSETLGGPALPAVGFAAGVERLALLIEQPHLPCSDIAVLAADDTAEAASFGIAQSLRHAGLSTVQLMSGAMGKKMKQAHKMGCRFVVILGPDELARDVAIVKDMQTGTQSDITVALLSDVITQMMKGILPE